MSIIESGVTFGTSPQFSVEGGYITLPITLDANELMAQALATIAANLPDWVPYEGHLEVILIEVCAQMVAEAANVATQVPLAIFRYFGETVLGVAPLAGAPATVPTTWAMVDEQGYSIPAGTYVTFPTSGNTSVVFQTLAEVIVPAGLSSTAAGEVILVATAPGGFANGLGGTYVLYDALAFVAGITSTAHSSGGVDTETDTAYLDRLSALLQLLTPRPILPPDFAALARSVAGVYRAVAIDGYNPVDGSLGNERMVALACVDANGNAISPDIAAQVQAYLQTMREVNFVASVISPVYTPISVSATLVALPGASPNAITAAAQVALSTFLSPANWGGGGQSPPQWHNETTVRYLEIAAVLGNVPGVDYVAANMTIGAGTPFQPAGPQSAQTLDGASAASSTATGSLGPAGLSGRAVSDTTATGEVDLSIIVPSAPVVMGYADLVLSGIVALPEVGLLTISAQAST